MYNEVNLLINNVIDIDVQLILMYNEVNWPLNNVIDSPTWHVYDVGSRLGRFPYAIISFSKACGKVCNYYNYGEVTNVLDSTRARKGTLRLQLVT
jgi:hypothetical protein